MLGGNPSTQMDGLFSSFQYGEIKYMVSEAVEEYLLASEEAAYEYRGGTGANGIHGRRSSIP